MDAITHAIEAYVSTANQVIELEEEQRIEVDGSKCVACGACFDACKHNARE